MKKTILFLSIFLLTIVYSQESMAAFMSNGTRFMSNGICYYIYSSVDKTVYVTNQYTRNNKDGSSVPTGYYTYWTRDLIGYDEDDNEIYQSYQYWFTSDYSGDIVIPSSVVYNGETYQVTGIAACAFNNISVNSLTIPSSITKISEEDVFRNFKGALIINCNTFAFEEFDDYEYTYYPYSGVLGGNQITSVSFGNTVTSITRNAFKGCTGLKTVTIPSSVTSIESDAFYDCSALATVTFLGSVSTIGSSAFPTRAIMLVPNGKKSEYVAKLGASYKVYEIDEQFDIDGLLYKIDFSTNTASIVGFSDDTSITIPETITVDGIVYPVTSIDEYGLSRKNGSDSDNSITEINIPSSIKSIGASAFIYCNSLTRVDITDLEAWCDIDFDNDYANPLSKAHNLYLNGVKIDDLLIPNSVENLKQNVFAGGHFSSVTIPSTTNLKWYYGNGQFERAEIGSITIVQDISNGAFFQAKIDHLVIDPSVNYGGYQSFNGATIGKLEIPYSETALTYSNGKSSYGLFENAVIDVAVVDRNMYSSYSSNSSKKPPFYISTIKKLHVGSHIASDAYKQCTLVNVYTKETHPVTIYANTFSNRSSAILYVPAGSKSAYQSATYWEDFKEIIEMPGSTPEIPFVDAKVKAICVANWDLNEDGELNEGEALIVRNLDNAFSGNTEIVSFDEFRYFTGLQTFDGFGSCTNLQSITIPKSISYFQNSGNKFSGCVNLSSLKVDEENSVYDSRNNCNAIIKTETNTLITGCKGTIIPNTVSAIDYRAFYHSGLTNVIIPSSVTSINATAFGGCSLLSIAVEEGNTKYDSRNDCNAIIETATNKLITGCKNTVIPNTVTTIGDYAFYENTSLTSVTIPNSVTSIGQYAFYKCSALTSVTIPNSVTSIGSDAFSNCSSLTSVSVDMETPIAITSNVFSNRANATLYVPKGCKSDYDDANYWKEFKVIKEYPDCDVNQDGEIDVVDVVDIARYAVGTPAENFEVFLADLNSDNNVNVADAVVLVNEIAGDTNWSRGMRAPQRIHNDVLALTENEDNSLSLQLEGSGGYTAFQFDLYVPEDVDVTKMSLNSQRKQMHQLLYNKVREGQWRVVALSTSNREFEGVTGELLNIALDGFATDDVVVDNIHFVTAQGQDVLFDAVGLNKGGMTTKVDALPAGAEDAQTIYSLSGQQRKAPQKGLNIIGGKKVVIK